MSYHTVILQLINLIEIMPKWHERFTEAIDGVLKYDLDEFKDIHNLDDWILWCNELLTWVPLEIYSGDNIDNKLLMFYFVLNQPSLAPLQNEPELSQWMNNYANAIGNFLDTTGSLTAESLHTFYNSPAYRMNEYMQSPSGWKTFNQLFARHVKPGYRPIDHLCDENVIVSVADSVFKGSWPINSKSEITVKGIKWSIKELLDNNPYADYFKNGTFMHAYLSPNDYHRLHTPLSGQVLYAEVVHGNVYLETYIKNKKLVTRRSNYIIKSKDKVGYQFTQTRGILILQTIIGPVAVLPIGMSLVSSVVMTAEPGVFLHKGEEFAYFQFGGSDYIMLFPNNMNIDFNAQKGIHYDQGKQIAHLNL